MPKYLYECRNCGYKFDRTWSIADYPTESARLVCPLSFDGSGEGCDAPENPKRVYDSLTINLSGLDAP